MRSNTKILDRIVYFQLHGDGEEAKLCRLSSPRAATKSGASGLAERASMMLFESCTCRANLASPMRQQLDALQKTPTSNRGPSI